VCPALSWPAAPPAAGGVWLRPFEPQDVALVRELSTDPYIPQISTLPVDADEDEALDWIERQHDRLTEGAGFSFCAVDRNSATPVGTVGLWTGGYPGGRATAGYSVAPSARGRGVATDTLAAVTGFAWSLPPLHRIELFIEPWNEASRRPAARAGYRFEGLLRSHQEIGGRRRDMELWARLRSDSAGCGPTIPSGRMDAPRR
jgi:RimJ/RimL family protein N-acetyltransferase